METLKKIEKLKSLKVRIDSTKKKTVKLELIQEFNTLELEILKELEQTADQLNILSKDGVKGTVAFNSSDDVMIKTDYGTVWTGVCNDLKSASWYNHTSCISFKGGQEVIVWVDFEVNYDKYAIDVIPQKISGGYFNQDQYEKLCRNPDLAFFKYPTGMSGLFKREG